MSAETFRFDYSKDIDTLEGLAQGEQTFENGGELFENLENLTSINFVLSNAERECSQIYEQSVKDLRDYQATRNYNMHQGSTMGLGNLDFIPGFVDNPVEKGYEDAEDLEEFSKEKLESIIREELDYNPSSEGLSELLGTMSFAGGAGAFISETVLEPAAEHATSALNTENVQQAAAQFTGDDVITAGAGFAAFAYGLSLIHQSNFYDTGVEMRARDEYIKKEAEELMEKYRDRTVK